MIAVILAATYIYYQLYLNKTSLINKRIVVDR